MLLVSKYLVQNLSKFYTRLFFAQLKQSVDNYENATCGLINIPRATISK